GAQIAQDHERGGAVVPALADVRASCRLAHRVQIEVAGQAAQAVEILASGDPDAQPLGPRLARRRGRLDLDQGGGRNSHFGLGFIIPYTAKEVLRWTNAVAASACVGWPARPAWRCFSSPPANWSRAAAWARYSRSRISMRRSSCWTRIGSATTRSARRSSADASAWSSAADARSCTTAPACSAACATRSNATPAKSRIQ